MSVVTNSLRSLSNFLQDHQISFANGLLVLFTIGGEQIFKFNAFNCPCTHDEAKKYVLAIVLCPAFILCFLGMAVSNLTWRVFHGIYYREKYNGCCNTCYHFIVIISRACIVPCAWLFLVLQNGEYLGCMMVSDPCKDGINDSEEYKYLVALSQFIGWVLLLCVIVISFIVICFFRCCDSVTYIQYKYINAYREAEQKQWDVSMEECTKELAKTNVNKFLKEKVQKADWDDISRVPNHQSKYTKNTEEIDPENTYIGIQVQNTGDETAQIDSKRKECKVIVIPKEKGENDLLTYLNEWARKNVKMEEQEENNTPQTSSV